MKIINRTNRLKNIVIPLFIISGIIIVMLLLFLRYQKVILGSNVDTRNVKEAEIYIPTDATFDEVVDILKFTGYIIDIERFVWLANRKNYPSNVKSGRYILKNKMSNNDLINLLRSGRQSPVNVIFNNIRTFEELSGKIAKFLEPDSMQLLAVFKDSEIYKQYNFNKNNFISMFIPNTYQMYWNTSPENFILRMHQEYKKFWNDVRIEKAEKAGLSPLEVSILASIVDAETTKNDEKPRVAGLYINRLKKGMRLEADPTIIFALGDFSINRVLNQDLKIASPYNTYIHTGLPPGPIRMPSIDGIDAVLNYEKHEYIFMCAHSVSSGYHDFAKTLEQHNKNAEKYRQSLKKLRIYR
jgi:UPF0755 protein